VILSLSLWQASKPLRDTVLKALVCCAVLFLVSLAGAVLLINHIIVTIGSLLQKNPTTRGRYG
jgi:hypothetical protein